MMKTDGCEEDFCQLRCRGSPVRSPISPPLLCSFGRDIGGAQISPSSLREQRIVQRRSAKTSRGNGFPPCVRVFTCISNRDCTLSTRHPVLSTLCSLLGAGSGVHSPTVS